MTRIEYDIDGALEQVSRMDVYAEDIGAMGKDLISKDGQIDEAWKGQDRTIFADKISSLSKNLEDAEIRYKDFDNVLRTYIKNHENTYGNLKSNASGLPGA